MTKSAEEINAEKASKPRVDIVPPELMLAAGRGLGYGVQKHGQPPGADGYGTWRIAGTEQAEPLTHYACLLRHLLLWRAGEKFDPESGLSHLDHAAAQLAILLDLVPRAGEVPEPGDPWALPDGLWWGFRRGWQIESADGCSSLWLNDAGRPVGYLLLRDDSEHLIDLLRRRRNAAEPGGQYREAMFRSVATLQEVKRALAEPTDPWALPDGLEWGFRRVWYVQNDSSECLWIEAGKVCGQLQKRPDAEHLIDLLRRRSEVEPKGQVVK
ncbi:MAG: hypothetical protein IPH07_24490 [Deltaproteobacteria bacterium]|nr:hypothetical protein [Deltaproteobacteria bacterium]